MILFNIYYGTIGKTLGEKYRVTKNFKNEQEAINFAKKEASMFYYKNEGKYGIPSFIEINNESNITGISIDVLYDEHIKDMMRYHVIPTEVDTIPTKKLRWG